MRKRLPKRGASKPNKKRQMINDQEKKEALEGIQMVYQAASTAALTAQQHEGVKNAAQKVVAVIEKINGTTVESPTGEVELVE